MENSHLHNNAVLKVLQQTFLEYSDENRDVTKFLMHKLMFENKLIDVCDIDIFYFNDLMNKINPESDIMTYESFIQIVFLIYSQQIITQKQNNEQGITEHEAEFAYDVNQMTSEHIGNIIEDRHAINSKSNLIKILMDLKEKDKNFFKLCCPFFAAKDFRQLINNEILEFVKPYTREIREKIFVPFAKKEEEKCISYMNIAEFHNVLFEFPLYQNFDCEAIASVVFYFLFPQDVKGKRKDLELIFDEKLTSEEIKKSFDRIDLDTNEINFTFSTFVLILTQFALQLKDANYKTPQELINYFFQEKLNLKSSAVVEIPIIEESLETEDEDFYPESETLYEAQVLQSNPSQLDEGYLYDNLLVLDKELPEIPQEIKSMQNPISNQSNTLFHNPLNIEKVKFPLNTLQVEIDEMNTKKQELKEKLEIEKAKKSNKSNARDAPAKQVWYEDLPDEKLENEKVFGNKPANDLKGRLLKNSYKEVLNNSTVYPSLIKEILLIPENIQQSIVNSIILAYKDQINGNLEQAIRKLERAQKEFLGQKAMNTQIDIFFNLTFGSFYESLELNLMAMKYYLKAKFSSERMYNHDPDSALAYCYLGSLMIRLREYEWAFRCFLKAKEVRENALGGDALDTATVYNNLGVCCYHLQCFYPAKGYFQLSYEIYKKHFGLFHKRTMAIKSNLSKLDHLNFNKPFEYKTPALYQTLKYNMDNPKKAKKK